MVVAVDVVGDLLSRLLERLELGAPAEPLLQLSEPAFDECLRFGVAVAAAPPDSMFGEPGAEAAAGEGRAIVAAEGSVSAAGSIPPAATAVSTSAGAASLRQRSSSDQPTISPVQQSIAAFKVAPAALGDPDARRAFAIDLVERLRDPLLTTHIAPAAVAFQAGEHDPQLLLRGPTPILALLAQPRLLLG